MSRKRFGKWLGWCGLFAAIPVVVPLTVGYLSLPDDPRLSPIYRFYAGVYKIAAVTGQTNSRIGRHASWECRIRRDNQVRLFFRDSDPGFQTAVTNLADLERFRQCFWNWRTDSGVRVVVPKSDAKAVEGYVARIRTGETIDIEKINRRRWERLKWKEILAERATLPTLSGKL